MNDKNQTIKQTTNSFWGAAKTVSFVGAGLMMGGAVGGAAGYTAAAAVGVSTAAGAGVGATAGTGSVAGYYIHDLNKEVAKANSVISQKADESKSLREELKQFQLAVAKKEEQTKKDQAAKEAKDQREKAESRHEFQSLREELMQLKEEFRSNQARPEALVSRSNLDSPIISQNQQLQSAKAENLIPSQSLPLEENESVLVNQSLFSKQLSNSSQFVDTNDILDAGCDREYEVVRNSSHLC